MESNEIQYPPFACPLRCLDASKPAKVKEPFLVYHILKPNEIMYHAIHSDNKFRASGVLVMNWQNSLMLDSTARLFKDPKEARKARLPVILVGYHYMFEYDLKSKKPKLMLSLKEASKLNICNSLICCFFVHIENYNLSYDT